ncbi:MAG: hypothetical protein AAFX44_18670 [Pseudomonadota bacterium]
MISNDATAALEAALAEGDFDAIARWLENQHSAAGRQTDSVDALRDSLAACQWLTERLQSEHREIAGALSRLRASKRAKSAYAQIDSL